MSAIGDDPALMSQPGAAPTDAPMDDAAPDDAAPEDDGSPSVLCTIMDNHDGTFSLVVGDEPDTEDDGLSGEAAEGQPPAAGGVAPQPAGKSFDSPGPLLKEVLDLLKAAEEKSGGGAEDNFNAGYNGGQQKY